MTVTTFRCDFDRIGRHRGVAPLTATVREGDDTAYQLSELVHRYARTFLASTEVAVAVELGAETGTGGTGTIFAGDRTGGTFAVVPIRTTTP